MAGILADGETDKTSCWLVTGPEPCHQFTLYRCAECKSHVLGLRCAKRLKKTINRQHLQHPSRRWQGFKITVLQKTCLLPSFSYIQYAATRQNFNHLHIRVSRCLNCQQGPPPQPWDVQYGHSLGVCVDLPLLQVNLERLQRSVQPQRSKIFAPKMTSNLKGGLEMIVSNTCWLLPVSLAPGQCSCLENDQQCIASGLWFIRNCSHKHGN